MLDDIDQQLLQSYQRDFPLTENPFKEIGATLGIAEGEVINRYQRLQDEGFISRIGPLVNHAKVGASTLVAIAAPPDTIEASAEIINSFAEINHNYLREHRYNLWFVVTAKDEARMHTVIAEIESRTDCEALVLPMIKSFYIDLGFKLWQ
jgi:DNA-binding Lrp family transcriptional regulator